MAFIYLSAADLGQPDFLAVVYKKWERQCSVIYKQSPQKDLYNGKPNPVFGTCRNVQVPKGADQSVIDILKKDGWLVHEYEKDFVIISQLPEFKQYCVLMGYCTAEAIVVYRVKDVEQVESKITISSGNLPLDMAAASFSLLVVKTKEKYLEQLMAEKPVPVGYCISKRNL